MGEALSGPLVTVLWGVCAVCLIPKSADKRLSVQVVLSNAAATKGENLEACHHAGYFYDMLQGSSLGEVCPWVCPCGVHRLIVFWGLMWCPHGYETRMIGML